MRCTSSKTWDDKEDANMQLDCMDQLCTCACMYHLHQCANVYACVCMHVRICMFVHVHCVQTPLTTKHLKMKTKTKITL